MRRTPDWRGCIGAGKLEVALGSAGLTRTLFALWPWSACPRRRDFAPSRPARLQECFPLQRVARPRGQANVVPAPLRAPSLSLPEEGLASPGPETGETENRSLRLEPAARPGLGTAATVAGQAASSARTLACSARRFSSSMASELKFLVPWGHIAAKAWGAPQGRPVLCLHGWLDNANTFSRLIPLLPKDCYYMALDFAGHGLSSHRPAGFPYHFFDYVTDVHRIVAELKWNRFSLMGHSLGGTVAGMFSCVFPELVDKLILVESYGFYPAPTGFDRGPGLSRQEKPKSLPTPRDGRSHLENSNNLLQSKRQLIEGLLSFEAKQQHSPKIRSPQAALQRLLEANHHLTEESGKILLQRGTTEVPGGLVYNRDMRALLHNHSLVTVDLSLNFLKKIQADILMVIAQGGIFNGDFEDSVHFIPVLQEAYRTNLKERFQLTEVAGNHFVHLNEPEVVAGIISAFLNKHQRPRASL